jgi:hypothetical protein
LKVGKMFEGESRGKMCYFVVGQIQLDDMGEVLQIIIFLENEFLLG